MRPLAWFPALVGMLFVTAPSWGQGMVAYPAPPRIHQQAASCARCGASLAHHHHAGSGHHHRGGLFCRVCAKFYEPDTSPLPPITLSRYAANGGYDCVKQVHGDDYPRFPGFWFPGQRYPLPHNYRGGPAGN